MTEFLSSVSPYPYGGSYSQDVGLGFPVTELI